MCVGALYADPADTKPYDDLPDAFPFVLDEGGRAGLIQEAVWNGGVCTFTWHSVRPIPDDDDFFENVWRSYRENRNVF